MLWLYRLITMTLSPLALYKLNALAKTCSDETKDASPTRRGLFALNRTSGDRVDLCVHGASVGEINMLQPLIMHYLDKGQRILVTTFTPTGLDQVHRLFGDRVDKAFAPIDTPGSVARWLDAVRPRAWIVGETELWPELFCQCHQQKIPIVLVNARLGAKRMRQYRRLRLLYRHAIKAIALAACQTEQEAFRWQALGLAEHQTPVTGNLKAASMRAIKTPIASLEKTAALWTAGSVHPKEDDIVLAAHQALLEDHPQARLILAPRHLRHLPKIKEKLDQSGMAWTRFDPMGFGLSNASVYLIESWGQLMEAYALADVAFVGGTLVDIGGHNLFEPACLGKPILAGPFLQAQQLACAPLQSAGGMVVVQNKQALIEALQGLMNNAALRTKMGQAAASVVRQAEHSLEDTIEAIEPHLGLDHLKH